MGDIVSNKVLHLVCNDNAASTTVLDSLGANNGTLTNAGNTSASTVAGPGGSLTAALNLDGTNDNITVTHAAGFEVFNAANTVALWVKPSAAGAYATIFAKGTAVRVHRDNATAGTYWPCTGLTPSVTQDAVTLFNGSWHHVAFVYTGSAKEVWLDGTRLGNQAVTGTAAGGGTNNLIIGSGGGGVAMTAAVCDFRIYSRALASGDVADLYALGTGGGGVKTAAGMEGGFGVRMCGGFNG